MIATAEARHEAAGHCPGSSTPTLRLWLVRLDVDAAAVAHAERDLTPAERDRALKGTPRVHRRRIVLRSALRRALGEELGLPAAAVPLGTSGAGRPEVLHPDVDAGCSASGAIGLVVVTRGVRAGIDVEAVAPWRPDAAREAWLTGSERRALLDLPLPARAAALTRCWTQKEAVLKGRGTGLTTDPATVTTRVGAAAAEIDGWDVRAVDVPHGWVASVATTARVGAAPPGSAGPALSTLCAVTG